MWTLVRLHISTYFFLGFGAFLIVLLSLTLLD